MFVDDYKPNSQKYKHEQEQARKEESEIIEPVAEGYHKQKTEFEKFVIRYLKKDLQTIKKYAVDEMRKSLERGAYNISTYIINTAFGKSADAKPSNSGPTPYRAAYRSDDTQKARAHYVYDQILYKDYATADRVLSSMKQRCENSLKKHVLVSDMLQYSRMTPETTDYKFGWSDGDLMGVRPLRNNDGSYYLNLPEPRPM